jgi:glycosyltransferase involved in cell wall biosynthesis
MDFSSVSVAVLFHRLGPYHHARLKALASQCALAVIEFSKIDNTYAWDIVRNETDYPVTSLFTDADIDTKRIDEISHQTKAALSKLAPQVVAIPGWSSPAALAALDWCCQTRTPAILMSASTAHDERRIWWKEWMKSRVVRLFSTAVVGGTPHVDYVAALGLSRDRVFKGYDVVDNDYFSIQSDKMRAAPSTLRPQHSLPENYFLASNRFIEKKNLPRLLEAYAAYVVQVGAGAWSLVMLGDGPLRRALTAQVDRLWLTDKVLFPGFKQYEDLPTYYGLSNAYIQASTTEQWGLVVNEAMASGLPVLVSDRCGCAPDLVKDGINGFTFDPHNVKDMTACMLQIAGNNCDLAAMGQASRDIIHHWSPDTFAENMLKAAEVALTAPRPKAGWFDRALLSLLARR